MTMNVINGMTMQQHNWIARRAFLGQTAQGLGAVALASLSPSRLLEAAPLRGMLEKPPLPQQAKRVIWLYMAGGMTHLDTFDHKPKLAAMHGQPMPESFTSGQQIAQHGSAFGLFQVQHDRALAVVDGAKQRRDVALGRADHARQVALAGLDLDDVGALIGEQAGGHGSRDHR